MYKRLFSTSAFLLALAMLANWTMPDNVGIGAIYYMMRDAILLAALGLAALAVAVWWRWLLDAVAQRFQGAGCKRECSLSDIPAPGTRGLAAVDDSAAIGPVTGETPVDTDGDGLFDRINLTVTLEVATTGDYLLGGWLTTADGQQLVGASYKSDPSRPLCSGVHAVPLSFDGKALYGEGIDGPYILSDISLTYNFAPGAYVPPTIDEADNWYTTAAYTWRQFEGDGHTPTASGSYFDNLHTTAPYKATEFDTTPLVFGSFDLGYSDPDSDGVHNSLVISATVAAIDRNTQEQLDWSGSLAAPDGALIETVTGRSQLYVGKTIVFDFSGAAISAAGSDGPYTLRNLTISQQSVPTQTVVSAALYTTPALKASDFEP